MHPAREPRQNLERGLAELFASQLGLVSRRQARALGFSPSSISRRIRQGRWIRVLPNVFRLNAVPESDAQALAAVAVWAGPGAALSHRSALKLWGGELTTDVTEVMTKQRRDPLPGIHVHQVRCLPPSHLTSKGGVFVTTPERTLLDIAGLGDPELLERAIRDLFDKALVSFKSLRSLLESPVCRGIPGRRILKKALWVRRETAMTLPGSFAECVRLFMRREGLQEPPDENVLVPEEGVVIPLAFSDLRLAILSSAHSEMVKPLRRAGWASVTVDVVEFEADPEYCALEIAAAMARAGAETPAPRRQTRVWRAWLDPLVRMRIGERIVSWRRREWHWYDVNRDFACSPCARRDWQLAQLFPDTFSELSAFRSALGSPSAPDFVPTKLLPKNGQHPVGEVVGLP